MKKTDFIFYLTAVFLFILSSCSSSEPEVINEKKSNFGIYLLEDQSITWESLQGRNLDSFKLKEWITSAMIDSMDYSSQVFYLNVDYNTLFSVPHNSNTPFVVVANDKRCYTGRFGAPADTTQPHVVITPMALCTDLVMLEFNPPHRKDLRTSDTTVKVALTSLGKLREGILYNLMYMGRESNSPPYIWAAVDRLNKEKDYIYTNALCWNIIKAGVKTYRTHLVLYNEFSYFSFPASIPPYDTLNYKEPLIFDPEKGYDWGYFRPFLNRENASTASPNCYLPEDFPSGNYYCYVEYYGGIMGGNKKMRSTPKGRMYIGYLRTNTIQIEFDSTKRIQTILNNNVNLK